MSKFYKQNKKETLFFTKIKREVTTICLKGGILQLVKTLMAQNVRIPPGKIDVLRNAGSTPGHSAFYGPLQPAAPMDPPSYTDLYL